MRGEELKIQRNEMGRRKINPPKRYSRTEDQGWDSDSASRLASS